MRHVMFPAIVVFALVAGLVGITPLRSAAQENISGAPTELCSAEELARGESLIAMPPAPDAGVVTPLGSAGEVLYFSLLTLPPDSCLEYRYRTGAVVLFVQEGTIDYAAHPSELEPDAEILKGNSDVDDANASLVEFDAPVTLHANEWVTQDRGVWYTFRNSGDEDAVVSISSYVVPAWTGDTCSGNCRNRP